MAGFKSFQGFAVMAAFSVVFFASSCKKEEVQDMARETMPKKIGLDVPANFPKPLDDPDNPLTEEGVALGRLLFYDTRLSGSNKLSCASCHHPLLAFSDGLALSNIGESGQSLPRHAPALINLAWATKGLFWDGGSTNLESQAFGPLSSADEMHQNLTELEAELKAIPEYVKRFKQAFGSEVK
jgi:cytochrome c peroxidase